MLIKRYGKAGAPMGTAICPRCGKFKRDFVRHNRHHMGSLLMVECCCDTTPAPHPGGKVDQCADCTQTCPTDTISVTVADVDASVCGYQLGVECPPGFQPARMDTCNNNLAINGTHSVSWTGCSGLCFAEDVIGTVDFQTIRKGSGLSCPCTPNCPDPCDCSDVDELDVTLSVLMQLSPASRWQVIAESSAAGGAPIKYFRAFQAIGVDSCFTSFTVPNELFCNGACMFFSSLGGNQDFYAADDGTVNVNF